jgi:large subunit ribosomal protein L3
MAVKGILGKKLGMSQVFDPETGTMSAVTVIEAGPCPVVQVKTVETDGYDAVQLAFEPVAERKLSKAEVGHLRKACAGRASSRPARPSRSRPSSPARR